MGHLLRELQSRSVMVLAISRVSIGCDLGIAVRRCLSALPADAARKLLLSAVGKPVDWDAADILRATRICGGNGLSIVLLARLIGNEHCSVQVSQMVL